MEITNTARWLDEDFIVYPVHGVTWNSIPGVYIFAGQQWPGGRWYAIYIGKTGSFSDRMPNHEREVEALAKGATAIHARVIVSEDERNQVEQLLIEKYQPELNLYQPTHQDRTPRYSHR